MIRRLTEAPTDYSLGQLATENDALSVNEVEAEDGTKSLAAYWEDDDPDALTKQQWADAVGAHTPAPSPPDPVEELDAAIDAVDTSTISDADAAQAIDDLKAALKGNAGQAGRADARPV